MLYVGLNYSLLEKERHQLPCYYPFFRI